MCDQNNVISIFLVSGTFGFQNIRCVIRWVNPELHLKKKNQFLPCSGTKIALQSVVVFSLAAQEVGKSCDPSHFSRIQLTSKQIGMIFFLAFFQLEVLPLFWKQYLVIPPPLSTTRPVNLIEDFRFYMQSVQVARCHMLLISDSMKARSYSWK